MSKEQLYYFLSGKKKVQILGSSRFKIPYQKKEEDQELMNLCDLTVKGKNKKLLALNKLLTKEVLSRSHNLYFYLQKKQKIKLEYDEHMELIIPFNLHSKYFETNKNIQKIVKKLNDIYNYNFCFELYAKKK